LKVAFGILMAFISVRLIISGFNSFQNEN
jgi:hypothetical protein